MAAPKGYEDLFEDEGGTPSTVDPVQGGPPRGYEDLFDEPPAPPGPKGSAIDRGLHVAGQAMRSGADLIEKIPGIGIYHKAMDVIGLPKQGVDYLARKAGLESAGEIVLPGAGGTIAQSLGVPVPDEVTIKGFRARNKRAIDELRPAHPDAARRIESGLAGAERLGVGLGNLLQDPVMVASAVASGGTSIAAKGASVLGKAFIPSMIEGMLGSGALAEETSYDPETGGHKITPEAAEHAADAATNAAFLLHSALSGKGKKRKIDQGPPALEAGPQPRGLPPAETIEPEVIPPEAGPPGPEPQPGMGNYDRVRFAHAWARWKAQADAWAARGLAPGEPPTEPPPPTQALTTQPRQIEAPALDRLADAAIASVGGSETPRLGPKPPTPVDLGPEGVTGSPAAQAAAALQGAALPPTPFRPRPPAAPQAPAGYEDILAPAGTPPETAPVPATPAIETPLPRVPRGTFAEPEPPRASIYEAPPPRGGPLAVRAPETPETVGNAVSSVSETLPPEPAVEPPTSRAVDRAASAAAREPSAPQKEAGNYQKGHVRWGGMDLSIENPRGGPREAADKSWRVEKMPAHYGYIRGSQGKDGDHVDFYMGPKPASPRVWIVDQVDAETGKFDEHKALLGFPDEQTAIETYKKGFTDGKGEQRVGGVSAMSVGQFRKWVKDPEHTQRPITMAHELEAREGTVPAGEVEGAAQRLGQVLEGGPATVREEETPYGYGRGTRLSAAYTAGRNGQPFAKHRGTPGTPAHEAWKAGRKEWIAAGEKPPEPKVREEAAPYGEHELALREKNPSGVDDLDDLFGLKSGDYRAGTNRALSSLFDRAVQGGHQPQEVARGVFSVPGHVEGSTILRSGDAHAQVTPHSVDLVGPGQTSLAAGRLFKHLFDEAVAGRIPNIENIPMTDATLKLAANAMRRAGVTPEQIRQAASLSGILTHGSRYARGSEPAARSRRSEPSSREAVDRTRRGVPEDRGGSSPAEPDAEGARAAVGSRVSGEAEGTRSDADHVGEEEPSGEEWLDSRRKANRAALEAAGQLTLGLEGSAGAGRGTGALQSASRRRPQQHLRGIDAGSGVRTLGLAITIPAALKNQGRVDLRGQKVKTASDLAVIARVFRDPRFETFRIYYVDVDSGAILAHEAITSRLPAAAAGFSTSPERALEAMRARIRRLEAKHDVKVGYWLQHNHPSGQPRPSGPDLALTRRYAKEVPGFKGHVIIDDKEFGLIPTFMTRRGLALETQLHDMPLEVDLEEEPFFKEEPGRGLPAAAKTPEGWGKPVITPGQLASIARGIVHETNMARGYVPVIYTDATGNVRAVQEMPAALMQNVKEASKYIRGRQADFGGAATFVYLEGHDQATVLAAKRLYEGHVLDDVVFEREGRRASLVDIGHPKEGDTHPIKAYKVGEDEKPYSSRAERTEEHERTKRPPALVGAPPQITSFAAHEKLLRQIEKAAKQGEVARYWYEESGRKVLETTHGSVPDARMLVKFIAIYSPQQAVAPNWDNAVRAFTQWKAGKPIDVPGLSWKNDAANATAKGKAWEGLKTNNFYINLMRDIDPTGEGHPDKMGTTVDLHIMRYLGFDKTAPTSAQYGYADRTFRAVAKKMGWEPQQVQAAVWTTQKHNREVLPKFPKGKAPAMRSFTFADASERNPAQVSWEATPHPTTGLIPGIHAAPYEQRLEYMRAVQKALLKDGVDEIAQELGLLKGGEFEGPGLYEGDFNPGTQSEFQALRPERTAAKNVEIDPLFKDRLERYAAARGYVTGQQAVAYHRPFYEANVKDSNGVDVDLGRTITEDELRKVYDHVMPGVRDQMAWVPSRRGLRVLNFSDLPNKEFHKVVDDALTIGYADTWKARTFGSAGDLVSNDWKENPDGEGYLARTGAPGGPDVQGAVERVKRRVDAVNRDFARRYGWDEAGAGGEQAGGEAPDAEAVAEEKKPYGAGAADRAGPFYSHLARVADKIPQTMKGADLQRFLQGKGVKAEELKWTGSKAFLEGKAGEKVTPEEFQRHVSEHLVKIEEVGAGEPKLEWEPEGDHWRAGDYRISGRGDKWYVSYKGHADPHVYSSRGRAEAGALQEHSDREVLNPKYDRDTLILPGPKKNYRELRLILPKKQGPGAARLAEYMVEYKKLPSARGDAAQERWNRENAKLRKRYGIPSGMTPEDFFAGAARDFKGTHFNERNILVHVRLDDRVDADGNKVLFLEEIQSDWATAGREGGFIKDADIPRARELPEGAKVVDFGEWGEGTAPTTYRFAVVLPAGTVLARGETREEVIETALTRDQALDDGAETPRGPFVTDPKAFTELALKRMLYWAAEHGYDKLAWTTGEQQADRYDLAKQVARVTVFAQPTEKSIGFTDPTDPLSDHTFTQERDYSISVEDLNGATHELGSNLSPAQLSEHIGKDLAKRAVEDLGEKQFTEQKGLHSKTYSGEGLKVGGKGMRAYYDEIVPSVMRGLVKKHGVAVGKTELSTGKLSDGGAYVEDAKTHEKMFESDSTDEARQEQLRLNREHGHSRRFILTGRPALEGKAQVHSVDVPPEMREGIKKEGFAVFEGKAGYGAPPKEPPSTARTTLFDGDEALNRLRNAGRGKAHDLGSAAMHGAGVLRDVTIYGASVLEDLVRKAAGQIPKFGPWAKAFLSGLKGLVKGLADRLQSLYRQAVSLYQSRSQPKAQASSVRNAPASAGAGQPSNPAKAKTPPRAKGTFSAPEETMLQRLQRQVQDRLNRIGTWEKAVREQGGVVRDQIKGLFDDVSPIAADKLQEARAEFVDPLIEHLKKTKTSIEDLNKYVYAKHAPTRNAVIAQRWGGKVLDGSGMTDAKAASILADFQKRGKTQDLEAGAKLVRKIREKQLEVLVDSGLLSKAEAAGWTKTFGPDYVPLKTAEVEEGMGTGQGFDIRGKEAKAAGGRASPADNPVAALIQQLDRAIVRGEKNKADQAFGKFSEDNGLFVKNAKHWKVEVQNGKAKLVRDLLREAEDFFYKVDGERVRLDVQSVDPLLDRALKNLSAKETGKLVETVGKFTRFYSQLVTSWNPEFPITNLTRDIQTILANTTAENSAKIARGVVKNIPAAMKGMYQALKDPNGTSPWQRTAKEFRENGGNVGWFSLKDMASIENEISNAVKRAGPGREIFKAVVGFKDFVERVNKAGEGGARLAYYKALRDSGVAPREAGRAARGISIDFTKKGEAGPVVNSLYAFFNANVQGAARLGQVLSTKRGAAVAGGVAALGLALDLYNRSVAGDSDDDGENDYDSIPGYVKDRNLVIMRGEGKNPILLPMPYGYNVIEGAGRQAGALLSGATTPGRAGMGIVSSLWNAFNPLGGEADLVQTLSPTFLDPIVQDVMNRDFTGKAIRPEGGSKDKPSSEVYFKNINPNTLAVAKWLNEATGGDRVSPGLVSISPETIEHYAGFATGGLGKFASNIGALATSAAKGEAPSVRNVPFVRRFAYEKREGLSISETTRDNYRTAFGSESLRHALGEAGYMPEVPQRTITVPGTMGKQVDLTQAEYQIFVEEDKKMAERLDKQVGDYRYLRMSDDQKRRFIQQRFTLAGENARKRVLRGATKRYHELQAGE